MQPKMAADRETKGGRRGRLFPFLGCKDRGFFGDMQENGGKKEKDCLFCLFIARICGRRERTSGVGLSG